MLPGLYILSLYQLLPFWIPDIHAQVIITRLEESHITSGCYKSHTI